MIAEVQRSIALATSIAYPHRLSWRNPRTFFAENRQRSQRKGGAASIEHHQPPPPLVQCPQSAVGWQKACSATGPRHRRRCRPSGSPGIPPTSKYGDPTPSAHQKKVISPHPSSLVDHRNRYVNQRQMNIDRISWLMRPIIFVFRRTGSYCHSSDVSTKYNQSYPP
jgi:hypothetical protein